MTTTSESISVTERDWRGLYCSLAFRVITAQILLECGRVDESQNAINEAVGIIVEVDNQQIQVSATIAKAKSTIRVAG